VTHPETPPGSAALDTATPEATEADTEADTETASEEATAAAAERSPDPIDRDGVPAPEDSTPVSGARLLEREGDLAADYLETLLDITDLDGDLDMDIEGDRATVDIVGEGLTALVGSEGETLDALQELTRLAVHRETGIRSRLMLDIGGFRARRRSELRQVGGDVAGAVRETGTAKALQPMTPFERKVVHDAIAEIGGVRSESEGEEPNRFVVVHPT